MTVAVHSDTYQVKVDSTQEWPIYPLNNSNSPSNVQVSIKNEGATTAWISTATIGEGDAVALVSGLTSAAVGVPDPSTGFSLAAGVSIIRPGRAGLYAITATSNTVLSIDIIKT